MRYAVAVFDDFAEEIYLFIVEDITPGNAMVKAITTRWPEIKFSAPYTAESVKREAFNFYKELTVTYKEIPDAIAR